MNREYIVLPERFSNSHKYDYGHIHIVGGSLGMSGAVCLSAVAALKTGAGLVTAVIPKCINTAFESNVLEAMSYPAYDYNGYFSKDAASVVESFYEKTDCIAYGMGIGRSSEVNHITKSLLKNYKGKLLIDADGLYSLSNYMSALKNSDASIVITPHFGEFSRLTGISTDKLKSNPEKYASVFAKENNVTVVLKCKNTVVTDGEKCYINQTGNNGMSTAGSGDVLSGIIASLIGMKSDVFTAACTGVYIHGLAGDYAKEKINEYSMTAKDIANNIYEAINSIIKGDRI